MRADQFSTLSAALARCERFPSWPALTPEARVIVVGRAMFGEAFVIALDFIISDRDDLQNALFGMLVGREADEENATGEPVEFMRRIEWLTGEYIEGEE